MPIYEFYSPKTHKIYSFYARSSAYRERVPYCPDGKDYPMEKVMSNFAVTGRAKEETGEGGEPAGDDPKMEAAMAEMEREMAGLDEENPDPRQMGHLMRKMADMTGEKMPPVMEEMIGRLEAGEDPEKLEEEYGDLPELENFGEPEGGEEGSEGRGKLRFRKRSPTRDPELYEFEDYLDERKKE